MSRQPPTIPATAHPGAPVLPWPVGQTPPDLPPGAAGIAVHVRSRRSDPSHYDGHRAVGVDGRPMFQGQGRMVVVTTPGEHLVEVRGRFTTDTVRRIRVAAGEIAQWDYWVPASYGMVDGVLAPTPARRRLGGGPWVLLTPVVMSAGPPLLVMGAGLPPSGPLFLGFGLGAPLAALLYSRVKRRLDRRYRTVLSHEAAEDVRTADTGMFLADGEPPAGLTDDTHGALLVTATAWLDYVCNGHSHLFVSTRDPNSWVPWPELAIDGTLRPFSWRTWAYRLRPGEHAVDLTVRSPGSDRHDADPVTVPVRIVAGQVTRVELRVKARTEVGTTRRGSHLPTAVAGFGATVDAKVR